MKKIFILFIILIFSFSIYATDAQDNDFLNAALKGDLAKVQKLLSEGANINATSGTLKMTALMNVVLGNDKPGKKEVFDFLIKSGADVKIKNSNNETAFHLAAVSGRLYAIEGLLEAGVDGSELNAQNDQGYTPLMSAIFWKQLGAIELLLSFNPDLTIKNNKGKTALMMAKEKKANNIVELLEKAGAK